MEPLQWLLAKPNSFWGAGFSGLGWDEGVTTLKAGQELGITAIYEVGKDAAWLEQRLKASAAKAQEGVAFLGVVTAVAGTQGVASAWVLDMATVWA